MLKKYGDFIAGLCGMALAVYLFVSGYQIGRRALFFFSGLLGLPELHRGHRSPYIDRNIRKAAVPLQHGAFYAAGIQAGQEATLIEP